MKDLRVKFVKLAVVGAIVFLIQEDGMAQSANSPLLKASGQFQVEFSRTARKPAPVISDPNDEWFNEAAKEVPAEQPMPLRMIVGTDVASMHERVEAAHALSNNLSRDEIAALCVFLKSTPAAGENDFDGLNWLKNDILNALREQEMAPPDLTGLLIEIYRERTQDSVMRDYAIQHLVLWCEQGAADMPHAQERIRLLLREAVLEPDGIAGTALLGWHRLSRGDAVFNPCEVDQCALRLAQSAQTDRATRLTAIQVCAERGLTAALPTINSLVDVTNCVPLRLSAVAAVRHLNQSQQPQCMELTQNADEGIAPKRAFVQLK
jgi:hypothetical protein